MTQNAVPECARPEGEGTATVLLACRPAARDGEGVMKRDYDEDHAIRVSIELTAEHEATISRYRGPLCWWLVCLLPTEIA